MPRRLILKKVDIPPPGNLVEDIDFICRSFGYFSKRDKKDTAGQIFRLLVKEGCGESKGLSSDEIAERLELTRGAIIHHINSFISSGLVVKNRNIYRIRCTSLQKSIEEIKDDINHMFTELFKIAKDIDNNLGHYYR
jgi:predicted transcriptional regulator